MDEVRRYLHDYSAWDGKQLRDAALALHAAKEEFFRLEGERGERVSGTNVKVRWGNASTMMNEGTVNSLLESVALAATAQIVGDKKAFPEQKFYPFSD